MLKNASESVKTCSMLQGISGNKKAVAIATIWFPTTSLSSLFFYFHQAAFFDPLCLPPPSTFSSYTPWGQLVTWEGVPIVHTENTRILKKGESWISF